MTREKLIEVMARAQCSDLAAIERAAQALAEHRDAGGIPWADKMELSRENWREAVRVVIEALEMQS